MKKIEPRQNKNIELRREIEKGERGRGFII